MTSAEAQQLIEQIKREARREVKAHENKKHCHALEELSRKHGFKSYAALVATAKSK